MVRIIFVLLTHLLGSVSLHSQNQNEKLEIKVKEFSNEVEKIITSKRDSMKIEINKLEEEFKNGKISAEELENKKKEISITFSEKINTEIPKIEEKFSSLIQEKVDATVRKSFYEKSNEDRLKELQNQYQYRPWIGYGFGLGFSNLINNFDVSSINNSNLRFFNSSEVSFTAKYTDRFNDFTSPFIYSFGIGFREMNLKPNDNLFFNKDNEGKTILSNSVVDLTKSKIRLTYLVVPFEIGYDFGKKEKIDNLLNYRHTGKNRLNLGIYAGFKIGEMRKMKYDEEGNTINNKTQTNFGFNDFIYGAELSFTRNNSWTFYVRKDFNSTLNSNVLPEQSFSFGIRLNFASTQLIGKKY